VVHHGGAGTTSTGLRAGKPTFTVPQAYDQRYWGRRVRALGCGPAPVRLRSLTPEVLANVLRELTTNPTMAANAAAVGKALSEETGLDTAVSFVEATIDAA